jgi:hypothetical protein
VAKKKQKSQKNTSDSAYFLKLVLLVILGSLWLKMGDGQSWQVPIPIGLIFGLLFISHEHFRIDRKIDYAVLLIAMVVGFWAPIGLYLAV